jgi:hypothetical protein
VSAPFRLEGGHYLVDWTSEEPTAPWSHFVLEPLDHDSRPYPWMTERRFKCGPSETEGHDSLINVTPDTYHLRASAPEGWTVTFTLVGR